MLGWELSPEEMRWEAYQEIRVRGVCTKYQIQARLMRKDANAHREHVIRELLELEVLLRNDYGWRTPKLMDSLCCRRSESLKPIR